MAKHYEVLDIRKPLLYSLVLLVLTLSTLIFISWSDNVLHATISNSDIARMLSSLFSSIDKSYIDLHNAGEVIAAQKIKSLSVLGWACFTFIWIPFNIYVFLLCRKQADRHAIWKLKNQYAVELEDYVKAVKTVSYIAAIFALIMLLSAILKDEFYQTCSSESGVSIICNIEYLVISRNLVFSGFFMSLYIVLNKQYSFYQSSKSEGRVS